MTLNPQPGILTKTETPFLILNSPPVEPAKRIQILPTRS